jgi:carbamoyltransferase
MLMVAPVQKSRRYAMTAEQEKLFGIEKLNVPKSDLPAITHVDYSARVQTVAEDSHPRFHALLSKWKKKTGCSVLVNTSFNVRGEPIVATPTDAYRCFMRTEMDALVFNNFIMIKANQPKFDDNEDWMKTFELD